MYLIDHFGGILLAGRDVKVAFKLTEEKKNELQEFANEYGVTMSGLVALIVGQWLYQQNRVINPMVTGITQIMKEQLQAIMNDDDVKAALIESAKNGEIKQIRQ